ncbi:transmembrane protein 165 [Lates japonicus]|uniref:GDT1 family protein n=1 Tax=Lates japonicus TaxID=270547 RepID=A0AAD3NLI3_LATJO|nr:transmembrane protein 165 [Lates japonicus]
MCSGVAMHKKSPKSKPVGPVVSEDDSTKGNLGFIHALAISTSVIIVSELGDKIIKYCGQALTLTFLAEWGDRSQLTTIILAAREDPFGVAVGGTLGHCLCTGLAVIGGRMIAQKISVRTVTIIGGIVFLAFAFSALFIKPESGF